MVYIFCTIPSGGEISEVVDVELLDGIGVGYSDVWLSASVELESTIVVFDYGLEITSPDVFYEAY